MLYCVYYIFSYYVSTLYAQIVAIIISSTLVDLLVSHISNIGTEILQFYSANG